MIKLKKPLSLMG